MNMALDRTREQLEVQAIFRGLYNGISARHFLSGIQLNHGQAAIDRLIREPGLGKIFGFKPGARFDGGPAI